LVVGMCQTASVSRRAILRAVALPASGTPAAVAGALAKSPAHVGHTGLSKEHVERAREMRAYAKSSPSPCTRMRSRVGDPVPICRRRPGAREFRCGVAWLEE